MEEFQILYVSKISTEDARDKITHVGGRNNEGGKWRISVEKAIEGIESNTFGLYVNKRGRHTALVVSGTFGKKILKATTDSDVAETLHQLPVE